jgi:hypothetical protein
MTSCCWRGYAVELPQSLSFFVILLTGRLVIGLADLINEVVLTATVLVPKLLTFPVRPSIHPTV